MHCCKLVQVLIFAGERIPIFVRHSHFKLPKQVDIPVVMVGPGTGLAPFRGFLQERAAMLKAGKASELSQSCVWYTIRQSHACNKVVRSPAEVVVGYSEIGFLVTVHSCQEHVLLFKVLNLIPHATASVRGVTLLVCLDLWHVSQPSSTTNQIMSSFNKINSNKGEANGTVIQALCGMRCADGKWRLSELMSAGAELGPAYLFFGCRKKSQDYIYEQELAMYARNGVLQKLFVAFSRDAASKVYVQHQMQDHAAEIAKLLSDQQGGHVYVCGDAKRMAKDVHAALLEMLQTQCELSSTDAEQKLKELTNSSRYQRDVW